MKIGILLLSVFVFLLYLLSFEHGDNIFSLPMQFSRFEINLEFAVKITVMITAVLSFFFVFLGLRYTSTPFWGMLLVLSSFAASFLGFMHLFGIDQGLWGYSAGISILIEIILVSIAINKANIYL